MPKREYELSEEEEKALTAHLPGVNGLVSIDEWVHNAIHDKARQHMDILIEEYTDKRAKKLSEGERNQIVRDAKVKTVKEHDEAMKAEQKERDRLRQESITEQRDRLVREHEETREVPNSWELGD